jgi:hypothetical protein
MEPFEDVISTRFAHGYKRKVDEIKRQIELESQSEPVSERVNWSAARIN